MSLGSDWASFVLRHLDPVRSEAPRHPSSLHHPSPNTKTLHQELKIGDQHDCSVADSVSRGLRVCDSHPCGPALCPESRRAPLLLTATLARHSTGIMEFVTTPLSAYDMVGVETVGLVYGWTIPGADFDPSALHNAAERVVQKWKIGRAHV